MLEQAIALGLMNEIYVWDKPAGVPDSEHDTRNNRNLAQKGKDPMGVRSVATHMRMRGEELKPSRFDRINYPEASAKQRRVSKALKHGAKTLKKRYPLRKR